MGPYKALWLYNITISKDFRSPDRELNVCDTKQSLSPSAYYLWPSHAFYELEQLTNLQWNIQAGFLKMEVAVGPKIRRQFCMASSSPNLCFDNCR